MKLLYARLCLGVSLAAALGCSSSDETPSLGAGGQQNPPQEAGAGTAGTSGVGGAGGGGFEGGHSDVIEAGGAGGTKAEAGMPEAEAGMPEAEAGVPEAQVEGGPTHTFKIQFDYRFDKKGFFTDPARRAVLEAAAASVASQILDDFETVPAGTMVRSRDPEDPTADGTNFVIEYAIDDIVVFVGSAELGGALGYGGTSAALASVADPQLAAKLSERYKGADHEPWTGWIAFDPTIDWFWDSTPETSDDIPASKVDMITVVSHELGHVLGFGSCDAWKPFVAADHTLVGPEATALYGGPVPLEAATDKHFAKGLQWLGKPPLMDPSDKAGERNRITALDLAALRDIGYETVE